MLLKDMKFPSAEGRTPAKWSSVFVEPIGGSGERLLIGVAAVSATDFVVQKAQLSKLDCLFGISSTTLIRVCEIALLSLEDDLRARGESALIDPRPLVAGVSLATPLPALTNSVSDLARKWLDHLSSLAERYEALAIANDDSPSEAEFVRESRTALPRLVHDAVIAQDASLSKYFRVGVRPRHRGEPRPRTRAFDVSIDYTGGRIVANIATLDSPRPASLTKGLKQKLWDLDAFRGRRLASRLLLEDAREHELLVLRPSDEEIPSQDARMTEMLGELEHQADPLAIRVRPLPTIGGIASHIVGIETRIA